MNKKMHKLCFALGVILTCSAAIALDDLEVSDSWIRAAPPGGPVVAYFSHHDHGIAVRYLISASPQGLGMTMIHRTKRIDGMVTMEHIDAVEVDASGRIAFESGGYHLMLMEPKTELLPGAKVAVELRFRDGSVLEATFPVKPFSYDLEASQHSSAGHSGGRLNREVGMAKCTLCTVNTHPA